MVDAVLGEMNASDERLTVTDGKISWIDKGYGIACMYDSPAKEWKYAIGWNGMMITNWVRSKQGPHVGDPRVRDADIRKQLARVATRGEIDIEICTDVFQEMSIYLSQHPEIIEAYFTSLQAVAPEEPIDVNILAAAKEILVEGDPVQYILDTFHSIHIGDDGYGRLLMLAIASQHVKNTHGIHLTPSGASGKGKSHAGKAMLHLVPRSFWLSASLSPKSLYYYEIPPGTIIFSDDVILSEELVSLIRRCITGFTESQEHITVSKDREGTKLLMPPRLIWIIASVENFMDMQTRNRMIDVPVDESSETDELVFKKQVEDAMTGADEFPETEAVLICREIFRIVKELDPVPVIIPFADGIDWKIKSNRRNFDVFKDFIKSYALIRHLQRDRDDNNKLVATLDDFHDAFDLYLQRAEGEATKLTTGELNVVRALLDYGECTVSMLQKILGVNQSTISRRLKGRDGRAGLLEKVPTLTIEKRADKIGESIHYHEWFNITSYNILSAWTNAISFKGDDVAPPTNDRHDRVLQSDISIEIMMRDAHTWWFNFMQEHTTTPFNPIEYLEYLTTKEPKYNSKERKESLLWIISHKKDGVEGWC